MTAIEQRSLAEQRTAKARQKLREAQRELDAAIIAEKEADKAAIREELNQ